MRLAADEIIASYAGYGRRALDRVSIAVEDGSTLAIVGPSGAGKTTLLRVIAGLLRARSGEVRLGERRITELAPQERRIAIVFQDDALFANMTVRENLRFAMRRQTGQVCDRVTETASALHVAEHLERRPRHLSGGERQRASIARALLSDPLALLLDEPLAHLDPSLRRSVRDEVVGVREHFAGPILYVTHDHVEAMGIGETLAVLVDGRIEDSGPPQRVYDAPRTVGVARFLGERPMNLFDEGQTIVGIRPELVRVVAPSHGENGRVVRRESTGADAYVEVETPRGRIVARVPSSNGVGAGDLVSLEFPAPALRRFDRASGAAIEDAP